MNDANRSRLHRHRHGAQRETERESGVLVAELRGPMSLSSDLHGPIPSVLFGLSAVSPSFCLQPANCYMATNERKKVNIRVHKSNISRHRECGSNSLRYRIRISPTHLSKKFQKYTLWTRAWSTLTF